MIARSARALTRCTSSPAISVLGSNRIFNRVLDGHGNGQFSNFRNLAIAGAAIGLAVVVSVSEPANLDSLPIYSRKDVAKRDGGSESGGRIWVTYGTGVYDITEFIASHPGGTSKILLGAGRDLEPFWNLYPFHKEKPSVLSQLESFRIGTVDPADVAASLADAEKQVTLVAEHLRPVLLN